MVTITRQVFIDFFQTKHFSAVKFYMGYEKNMSFHVIPKSPKVWKKVEKIGLGSFKTIPYRTIPYQTTRIRPLFETGHWYCGTTARLRRYLTGIFVSAARAVSKVAVRVKLY